jgi:predicted dehydrogenase
VTSAKATIYLAESVAKAVISRAGTTTPSINTMTYLFDLLTWYLDGQKPATVYAAGTTKGKIYEEYGVVDSTWCVLTYADGTVANLGVSWELPEFWPAYVATMDFELFGRNGTVSVKDDHRDVLMASHKAIPSPYTPDATMHVAMLGSYMPGDWALGEHFGAMQEETHAFINAVGQNRQDPILATGEEGIDVLVISRAVDQSAKTGEVVTLEW